MGFNLPEWKRALASATASVSFEAFSNAWFLQSYFFKKVGFSLSIPKSHSNKCKVSSFDSLFLIAVEHDLKENDGSHLNFLGLST